MLLLETFYITGKNMTSLQSSLNVSNKGAKTTSLTQMLCIC